MILINTRPVWNLGRNIWNRELRRNLNPGITLLSAPTQEISLYGERKIGTLLMKRQIQFLLSCEVKKKIILFTSPTSVEAFFKILKKRSSFPCLLYTSPSPRDLSTSRMPSSA